MIITVTTSESAQEGKTHKDISGWKEQNWMAEKFEDTTWFSIKIYWLQGQAIKTKHDHPK